MKENVTCSQWVWGITLFVSLILLLVLLPLSFSYVEYDEYALKKHTVENTVETDSTYDVGRYYWGVDRTALPFSRHFQKVTETFSIFPTNGLEFDVDVVFWYRIQKENLGQLYKAFGTSFDSQVRNRANAKIKNVAPTFALDDYITNRPLITTTLHAGLVPDLNNIYMDLPADKFYLANVEIPAEVKQKDLDAAVQSQRNIEEQNHQLAALVRKETDKLVEEVAAEIDLIGLTATAQADALKQEAEAVAEKTESAADGLGLKNLFLQVNVTTTPIKEKYIAYFAFLDSLPVSA
jgi:regulator of protease activity HflC (stomatin/prohibitin superfamily)